MALLVQFIFYLVRLFPVRVAGAIGAGAGRVLYILDARHRSIALRNLDRIYPEMDDGWKIRVAHESFAEMCRTMFELPHVFLRSQSFLWSRVEFIGLEELEQARAKGHGILFVAGHHCNWELGALLVSPSHSLYRAVRQEPLERFLQSRRERFGNTLHDRNDNMRWLPKALRQGEAVSMMVDQHLSTANPVLFMGHPAQTTTLPAAYARKYQTPVFSVLLHRIGRSFRFQLELREIPFPVAENSKEEDLLQCTSLISDRIAQAICPRPELWLWLHRRWLYLDEKEQDKNEKA